MSAKFPENHDSPNVHIVRGLDHEDYEPYLTEIGRLAYYWSEFESYFDKILYEIWKLEWKEPEPRHLKIPFSKRICLWKKVADRRLAKDRDRHERLRNLLAKATLLRRQRDLLLHGGPFINAEGIHWYVVQYGEKPKMNGELMPISRITDLSDQINEAHKELSRLDYNILRFPAA